jgi:hypothetical protein
VLLMYLLTAALVAANQSASDQLLELRARRGLPKELVVVERREREGVSFPVVCQLHLLSGQIGAGVVRAAQESFRTVSVAEVRDLLLTYFRPARLSPPIHRPNHRKSERRHCGRCY